MGLSPWVTWQRVIRTQVTRQPSFTEEHLSSRAESPLCTKYRCEAGVIAGHSIHRLTSVSHPQATPRAREQSQGLRGLMRSCHTHCPAAGEPLTTKAAAPGILGYSGDSQAPHTRDTARSTSAQELSGQANTSAVTCPRGHFTHQAEIQEAGGQGAVWASLRKTPAWH